jgi:hypothetical protein
MDGKRDSGLMAQPSMKKLLAVALFVFAAVLNSVPAATNQPPTSAEQLRSELEAAMKAKDIDGILALFYQAGVSNKNIAWIHKSDWSKAFQEHPRSHLDGLAELKPRFEEDSYEKVANGFQMKPNLSVQGNIHATFTLGSLGPGAIESYFMADTYIPYGEMNGCFYLAGTTVQKIYEPKAPEKIFFLSVSPSLWPEPVAFTGTYIYVQNNKEIEKTINGTNTFQKIFWGDYVKSCTVQKTDGGKSSVKLEIKVSVIKDPKEKILIPTTVFSGETTSTNDSIAYERKN